MTEYTPLGGEFLVNSSIAGNQWIPDVAALVGGGFIKFSGDPSGLGGDSRNVQWGAKTW